MICRQQMLGHSVKSLCRGPDPRQRTALGKDSLPRARQAHGNNNFLPWAKPSAKGWPSATSPDTMSIPYRQYLPRASPLGPRQRLFNRFCNFFLKILCRAPCDLALGKDSLCRVPRLALGKLIFFFVFSPHFFLGLATVIETPFQNLGQF